MAEFRCPYSPQPKQRELHASCANEILFGGAAGPGKSTALRWEGVEWCIRVPRLQVYLFRRTYPELHKTHILPLLEAIPRGVAKYNDAKHCWSFPNGSVLHLCHCQYEKDVFAYQGTEIHLAIFDELTTFTEFIYNYIRSRVRCTLDLPEEYRTRLPGIVAASNPCGVGHSWVKRAWVEFCGRNGGIRRAPVDQGGMVRHYIPALIDDNPRLVETNPGYKAQLEGLPEPYRTAYLRGDWDVFIGQAFEFGAPHIIKPQPIPDGAPLLWSFDWGYGKPFDVQWWYVDPATSAVVLWMEFYGGKPKQQNAGLRLTDDEIAERIVEMEKRAGVWGAPMARVADPTVFNRKPDYARGGQSESTADLFAKHGIQLRPGIPDRLAGWRQMHRRLRYAKDADGRQAGEPGLKAFETCTDFIRVMQELQPDPNNVEDVDTRQEDHPYDAAKLIVNARPMDALAVGAFDDALTRAARRGGSVFHGR